MVQIPTNTGEISVKFPKTTAKTGQSYTLTLHSDLTLKDYEFSGLTDNGNSAYFYAFTLDLTALEDGEYRYTITSANVAERGLLRIGEITNNPTTYNRQETIIEYEG